MYKVTEPFAHTLGPKNAKIMLVGEAWGKEEDRVGRPFIGASGQELTRMLREAGIERNYCLLSNVLPLRPPDNKLEALCTSKKDAGPGYGYPALSQGNYLRAEYLPELQRLKAEIQQCNPNLIVALGNTACWALLMMPKIGAIRGATAQANLAQRAEGYGYKILPTYHPAAVLRNWTQRVIVVADLMKAKHESAFPEIRRPERKVLINPTLDELAEWITRPAKLYSADIETTRKQIDMLGFARSTSDAIVVPFADWTKPDNSYWPTLSDEREARLLCNKILGGPVPKVLQNGNFDAQYLLREGFQLRNFAHDTMLLSHSLFPELQKGLGFLGSIYTSESSWKLMRHNDSNKREE